MIGGDRSPRTPRIALVHGDDAIVRGELAGPIVPGAGGSRLRSVPHLDARPEAARGERQYRVAGAELLEINLAVGAF
jgi:hypothetical protein